MLHVVDEFTHESLEIVFDASSTRRISSMFCASCSSPLGFPGTFFPSMARSSSLKRFRNGSCRRRKDGVHRTGIAVEKKRLRRELHRPAQRRTAKLRNLLFTPRRAGWD